MKITVVGRQMNVTEELRGLAEKKLAKLDRYFESEEAATVTFSRKRNRENIEITISAAGTLFRCETDDETFRNAIDRAVETIDRQIRKNKTKLEKRLRKNAFAFPDEAPAELVNDEDEGVVRHKKYSVRPMSVEDAVLQLKLVGHEFFVFVDADTMETCVVYARRDGGYGLMVPER